MDVIPKETFLKRKKKKTGLNRSCLTELQPAPCPHACLRAVISREHGDDSELGMCALEIQCLEHASTTWKKYEVIQQHFELARGFSVASSISC